MNWILGLFLFLISAYLINRFLSKRKLDKTTKNLEQAWGKPKDQAYFNMQQISRYFKNYDDDLAYQRIDAHTADDLDIDAVFKYLDRTSSRIGQQYLYYKLRVIQPKKYLDRFARLTQLFTENSALRKEFQQVLTGLNTANAYYLETLLHLQKEKKPKIFKVLCVLSLMALITIILSFFYPVCSLLLFPIFAVNMFFHYRNKDEIMYNLKGLKSLSKSLKIARFLAKSEQIKPFFEDVYFLHSLKSMKIKMRYFSLESRMDHEFMIVFWLFMELLKILFNIEYILFYRLVAQIEREQKSIDRLFQFIGEIDTAISCASIRAGAKQTCIPKISQEKRLFYEQITHPLIDDCVTNNLSLNGDSVLLTGSNMSGKSTFIRTVALNALLAQTLGFCFAKSYRAPFFKIYSSIRISDDLLNEKSYYLEEVLRIQKLIDAANQTAPCLFVMDELLKGTNTVERVAAGASIISYLNKKQHRVFVATHDLELSQLLAREDFKLFHFTETIQNNQLYFDHKLKPGPLKTRNAIKILVMNNYPKEVIQRAKVNKMHLENFNYI